MPLLPATNPVLPQLITTEAPFSPELWQTLWTNWNNANDENKLLKKDIKKTVRQCYTSDLKKTKSLYTGTGAKENIKAWPPRQIDKSPMTKSRLQESITNAEYEKSSDSDEEDMGIEYILYLE